jgi:hypothetical protein
VDTRLRELTHFLQANDAYFLLGLSLLSLILLIGTISLAAKLRKLGRKRNSKLQGDRLGDILDCLTDQQEALERLDKQLADVLTRQFEQAESLAKCLKNVGIVRFNAFDDVGGEQSFAVVMLDPDRNGVALSSIYGRQDSRVYAKAVAKGQGERPLSDEEQKALDSALN